MNCLSYLKNWKETGTLISSSKYLALEIQKQVIKNIPEQGTILEIGAGTGALTEKLNLFENLDILEINPSFAKELKEKFPHRKIMKKNILEWQSNNTYDIIVSSLPFNSFSSELNFKFIKKIKSLMNNDATLIYFEYFFIGDFKNSLKSRRSWSSFLEDNKIEESICWRNFPPARVKVLKFN